MENNISNYSSSHSKDSKFELIVSVLDSNLMLLFNEIFKKTRRYELGIDFYNVCQKELNSNKDKIEAWKYDLYQEDLIQLKLEMLDYLNEWDEYISFTNEILDTLFIECRFNFYIQDVNERYIIKDNTGTQRIHFLCRFEKRYDIISRKVLRRNAGKTVKHLERHQQDRLSLEEIEHRYKIVVDFFNTFHGIDL